MTRLRRHAIKRSARKRGNVLILMTITLPALLGIAALVIDIGRLAIGAQHLQDVVDAAALAGAAATPDMDEARTQIEAIVAANNSSTPGWPVSLDPDSDLIEYEAGDEIPGFRTLTSGEHALKLVGHLRVEYVFAKIFGLQYADLSRSAIALHQPSTGGTYALFAGDSDVSSTVININGSYAYIDGVVHGNSKVRINGSHHTITGALEYVNDYTINGSNVDIQGGIVESTVMPYPIDYTWDDFGPTDTTLDSICVNGSGKHLPTGKIHVLGDMTINGSGHTAENSLYMVEGDVRFNGSGHVLENVTIVAKGSITFNGACQKVTPYQNNIALMSLATGTAITYNGSHQTAEATLFAPNGEIRYNGSNAEIHNGSVIGYTIRINGSGFTIQGTVTGAPGPDGPVGLIQ